MRVKLSASNRPGLNVPYWQGVTDIADAQRQVLAYIARHGLGAGCSTGTPAFTGGEVYEQGQQIATISYNGRV